MIVASLIMLLGVITAVMLPSFFGFNSLIPSGFFVVGLVFCVRDYLIKRTNFWYTMFIFYVGVTIAYFLFPSRIDFAVGGAVAFTLASAADWLIERYCNLRIGRFHFGNVAGSFLDSYIYQLWAFGYGVPWMVVAQYFAKLGGATCWSYVIRGDAFDRFAQSVDNFFLMKFADFAMKRMQKKMQKDLFK